MSRSDSTDLFLALTPEKVLEAVEAAGHETHPVCYPLNSFENRVYEVELLGGSRVVAKFYRPRRWSAEQILEEHRLLAELDAEEIPVAVARPFDDGSTLRTIDGIHYCLFDRRGGRAPDELDAAAAARLGMWAARLHNVGARHAARHRPALTAERYVRRNVAWLKGHRALPRHLEKRYTDTATRIAEIAEERMEGVATHRIHADLHLGNVLFRDGELRVIDFDDFCTGPAVQDVWLALPGRDPESMRLREVFLEAYEQLRSFDRSTLRLVEPLRGLRMVRYAAWLARRWHDPAFRAGWPHFGTPEYWQQETDDLVEQLAVIEGEPAAGPEPRGEKLLVPAREELLTNKDYFWDWEE